MTTYQCPGCGGAIVGAEVCPDCRMQFPANVETVEEGMNIDNLRALLATRESMHAKPLSRIEATEELIYALPALLDRLEVDALDSARYRWLREQFFGVDFRFFDDGRGVLNFVFPEGASIGIDLDAAIDAVRGTK